MEDQPLPSGKDLVHEIREKYFNIKLKHDILKKKYEAVRKEYCDVKKELDIVREELFKHEPNKGKRKCNDHSSNALKNGVSSSSHPDEDNNDLVTPTFNLFPIKREIEDNDETAYSPDEFVCNPNHSGDELESECGSEIFKLNINGRLNKRSRQELALLTGKQSNRRRQLYNSSVKTHEENGVCSLTVPMKTHEDNETCSVTVPSDGLKQTFNHMAIKREIDENGESDDLNYVVTVDPYHPGDEVNSECGGEIIKVNTNGRLKKRSRDFYRRHNEFMQNSCRTVPDSDTHVSPYPNISPVQCYYNGDKHSMEIIDGELVEDDIWAPGGCGMGHTPELFKECKICSSEAVSDDNIPHSSSHHYSDTSSTPVSWPHRKRNEVKPYKCEICGNIFAGVYNYNRHKLIHTGEKPFKCHLCEKTFARKDKYKVHIRTHHQTSELSFDGQSLLSLSDKNEDSSVSIDPSIVKIEPLDEAPIDIINNSYMHNSKSSRKKINNITLECDICFKKVQGPLNLLRHKERHADKKPKVCDVCGKVFKKTYSFNRHRMLHTGEKPFICNLCGEGFSRNDKLLVHTRKHKRYSPDKMPFKCDVCDLFFSESDHVTKHQLMHTGEVLFTCDICFKSFKLESDLIVHRKSRHIIRPESKRSESYSLLVESYTKPKATYASKKQYKCNDCGKMFTERFRLARHKRAHTSEKSHKCIECGKEFIEKFVLNRHEKTHSKHKPHACEVCGKNFLEKSKLIRHKKIHDNIRPFKCGHCGKAFIEKHRLVNHQKTHLTFKYNLNNTYFTDPDSSPHQLLHNDDGSTGFPQPSELQGSSDDVRNSEHFT